MLDLREDLYSYEDSVEAEQNNTLLMIDALLARENIHDTALYILGGTALLFHHVTDSVTVDIDVANKLSKDVLEATSPFISDNASEVAVLATNYKDRSIPYHVGDYSHIRVFLLSIEDLIVTKLGSSRIKDLDDLRYSKIMCKCDTELLESIINNELDSNDQTYVKEKLKLLRR